MAQDQIRIAAEMGAERGKAAASWVFDGNTTHETYVRFLKLWDEGDPAIDEFGPTTGWLSGEFAEGPTPTELGHELGFDTDDEIAWYGIDAACDAYETAADEAYWGELEATALRMTESE